MMAPAHVLHADTLDGNSEKKIYRSQHGKFERVGRLPPRRHSLDHRPRGVETTCGFRYAASVHGPAPRTSRSSYRTTFGRTIYGHTSRSRVRGQETRSFCV